MLADVSEGALISPKFSNSITLIVSRPSIADSFSVCSFFVKNPVSYPLGFFSPSVSWIMYISSGDNFAYCFSHQLFVIRLPQTSLDLWFTMHTYEQDGKSDQEMVRRSRTGGAGLAPCSLQCKYPKKGLVIVRWFAWSLYGGELQCIPWDKEVGIRNAVRKLTRQRSHHRLCEQPICTHLAVLIPNIYGLPGFLGRQLPIGLFPSLFIFYIIFVISVFLPFTPTCIVHLALQKWVQISQFPTCPHLFLLSLCTLDLLLGLHQVGEKGMLCLSCVPS